ncbi:MULTISPECIES: FliA/WhiG family RNA polymerase sigma factor [Pseudescherichia]|uniref:FliA/WhiG family RNA polymerase sigma factor n=1 Tax=Pseudescherichia TaxID=2055880 RepID=UPI001EDF545B|nr:MULTISPECIES: FliA/WhiG family RNA polymerase sigma factor [Pseudescherichia]
MLTSAPHETQAFQTLSPLTPAQESHYLQAYLPLVRKVVKQLAPQCSCVMEREDMQQVALIGLLDALRRYGKPDEGFGGYAVQRIRGAVLDALRRLDWRPRQLRQKFYHIKDLIRERRKVLGREPEPGELDGVSAAEYQQYLALEGADTLDSLDALLSDRPGDLPLQGRRLEDQIVTQHMLSRALQTLSAKEQQILYLYYQQDMNLKEIALVLGLTEARICQLNKKIAEKLRTYFFSH